MSWSQSFDDQALARMAFLHCEFMGRRESMRFAAELHSEITYVYDTDVISAFTRPWEVGPDTSGGWGYGQLLPRRRLREDAKLTLEQRAQEDGSAWHTTRILAHNALTAQKELNGNAHGLVMFDPHYNEARWRENQTRSRALGDSSFQRASTNRGVFARATINLLNATIEKNANTETVLRFLSRRMESSLLEHFDGRSRFSRASENFDILHNTFGAFEAFSDFSNRSLSIEVSPRYKLVESYAEKVLIKYWSKRLSEFKPGSDSLRQFRNDVDVLTNVALVNRRLLEVGKKHRIVFVSGDRNLVRSAYTIDRAIIASHINRVMLEEASAGHMNPDTRRRVGEIEDDLARFFFNGSFDKDAECFDFDWFSNFSFHYVRHFWAVAGEALIESADTSAFQDLFHGLFASRGGWVRTLRRNIEDLVVNGPRESGNESFENFDPDDCLSKWESLTASRIRDARAAEFGIGSQLPNELKLAHDVAEGVPATTSLVDILIEHSNRKRDRMMLSLSDLGALELMRSMGVGSDIPDLYFVSLPNTIRILRNLSAPRYYSSASVHKFLDDFDSIKYDCFGADLVGEYDDRQLSHVKFLILATIFASGDRWVAATGHARRALNVIKRFETPIPVKAGSLSHMSGREANFLLAICTRKRAEEYVAFDNAQSYMKECRRCLRRDKGNNSSIDMSFHSTRFLNEELAIALGRYYFMRSENPNGATPEFVREFGLIRDSLSRGASAFFEMLSIYISGEATADEKFPPLTVNAIALNIIQVWVISVFRDDTVDLSSKDFAFSDLCRASLLWLNMRKAYPIVTESKKARAYRLAAGALHGTDDFPSFRSMAEVDELFVDLLPRSRREVGDLPRYEVWRRKALKEFVMKRCL